MLDGAGYTPGHRSFGHSTRVGKAFSALLKIERFLCFKQSRSAMLHFVRGPTGFSVGGVAPPLGVVYPEIALSADQKVKLVDLRAPSPPYTFPPVRVYMPSLLKSNLQKAVRRRYIEEAFVTVKHLLAQDASELLRRLPIIMCEDSLLHAELFLEIVWLMAAVSKGYRLCAPDCQRVMDFVGACLSASGRYNLQSGATFASVDISKDPVQLAFALRIAYGGMACDSAFMERLLTRVASESRLPRHSDFLRCVFEKVGELDLKRHILPEAIDFHCFPSILAETGVVKQAIWYNWSAPNVRAFVGLDADLGARAEAEGRDAWPLSVKDTEVLEDFAEKILERLHGRPPSPPVAKQMRLTGFVKRS